MRSTRLRGLLKTRFSRSSFFSLHSARIIDISSSDLLPYRALRAQIEDLAARLDHPTLAAHAKHYESIKLNKQLREAVRYI